MGGKSAVMGQILHLVDDVNEIRCWWCFNEYGPGIVRALRKIYNASHMRWCYGGYRKAHAEYRTARARARAKRV